MVPPSEEVQEWLELAEGDLQMARRGMEGPDPLLLQAAFHSQQAAEKALKGLLSHHGIEVERTHNLPALLRPLEDVEPGIEEHLEAASTLTPYGVDVRYPGLPRPDESEVRQALRDAETILEDVRHRLA